MAERDSPEEAADPAHHSSGRLIDAQLFLLHQHLVHADIARSGGVGHPVVLGLGGLKEWVC